MYRGEVACRTVGELFGADRVPVWAGGGLGEVVLQDMRTTPATPAAKASDRLFIAPPCCANRANNAGAPYGQPP